jgi:hypothetical protein
MMTDYFPFKKQKTEYEVTEEELDSEDKSSDDEMESEYDFVSARNSQSECCIVCEDEVQVASIMQDTIKPAQISSRKPRVHYDIKLLQSNAQRDGFCIKEKLETKLNRNIKLCCICYCGNEFVKGFRYINEGGGFCSTKCKEKVGCKLRQQPCRDCPEDDKKKANYPNEDGKINKLCADCAKKAGTYKLRNPCRDCPKDDKKQAHYPDEDGKTNKLCADCAKKAGTYKVLNPCRDCPKDDKKYAHYPDEDGKTNKLCGDCAKKAGTYKVLNPCRDCPENDKKEAHYPDEDGKIKLCADCAVRIGTHVDTGYTGASYEACRCFCRLEKVYDCKLPHIHYLHGGGHEGTEKKGLIPGRNFRPDSFLEDTSGKTAGSVFFYHGQCHGYPPDHPLHKTYTYLGVWGPDAYQQTIEMQDEFLKHNYRVFVIWSYEYVQECERVKCPRNVSEVCREYLG